MSFGTHVYDDVSDCHVAMVVTKARHLLMLGVVLPFPLLLLLMSLFVYVSFVFTEIFAPVSLPQRFLTMRMGELS